MKDLRAIVGLGNPGERYSSTRHNIGFLVVDELALRERVYWRAKEKEYLETVISGSGYEVSLIKPTIYMNDSGYAIKNFLERTPVPIENLLIILDDVNLPLGKLRFRKKGSDGGHNGLASTIHHLGSEFFPRLRLGIGPPSKVTDLLEFVLGRFADEEQLLVQDMVAEAVEVSKLFIAEGSDAAMNLSNIYQSKKSEVFKQREKSDKEEL